MTILWDPCTILQKRDPPASSSAAIARSADVNPPDAAEAGYRVGSNDPSRFIRDDKRHAGHPAPPSRDVEHPRDS